MTSDRHDGWQEHSTQLLRAIDPHKAHVPIHLFVPREVESCVRLSSQVAGGTHPLMSYFMLPILGHGYSNEPAFCCVVDPTQFNMFHPLVGAVLHEFSHFVERFEAVRCLMRGMTTEQLDSLLRPKSSDPPMLIEGSDADPRPWSNHGPDLIRLVVHINYRAQLAGWPGDEDDIFGLGLHYGVSRASTYAEHLADELADLIELPLCKIPNVKAPRPYVEFSAADLQSAEDRYQYLKRLQGEPNETD